MSAEEVPLRETAKPRRTTDGQSADHIDVRRSTDSTLDADLTTRHPGAKYHKQSVQAQLHKSLSFPLK